MCSAARLRLHVAFSGACECVLDTSLFVELRAKRERQVAPTEVRPHDGDGARDIPSRTPRVHIKRVRQRRWAVRSGAEDPTPKDLYKDEWGVDPSTGRTASQPRTCFARMVVK